MFLLVSLVEQREKHNVVPSKTGGFDVCSRRETTCSSLQAATNSVCGRGTGNSVLDYLPGGDLRVGRSQATKGVRCYAIVVHNKHISSEKM